MLPSISGETNDHNENKRLTLFFKEQWTGGSVFDFFNPRGKGRVILLPTITTYKTRDSNFIARFFSEISRRNSQEFHIHYRITRIFLKICNFHDYCYFCFVTSCILVRPLGMFWHSLRYNLIKIKSCAGCVSSVYTVLDHKLYI